MVDFEKYEEMFVRLLGQINNRVIKLIDESAFRTALHLQRFKIPKDITNAFQENPWLGNKIIENIVDIEAKRLAKELVALIEAARVEAVKLSESKALKFIEVYLGAKVLEKIVDEAFKDNLAKKVSQATSQAKAYSGPFKRDIELSKRIWNLESNHKEMIANFCAEGLTVGRSAPEIARDLKQFLWEPDKRFRRVRDPETGKLLLSQPAKDYHPGQGVYRSSYQNALRVARSETNMAYRLADQERWDQMEFVTGFEVKMSPQHPKSDVCNSMKGIYPKGFVWSGWHPACICFSVPVTLPAEAFVNYLTSGKIPESAKIKTIPSASLKYVNDNREQIARLQSTPYFVKDNFTLDNGKYVFNPQNR